MTQVDFDSEVFKNQISKIKNLEDYKLDLAKLSSLTSGKMEPSEVGNIFMDLAILLPFPSFRIGRVFINDERFFRVRSKLNPTKENLYTKAPFIYPPVGYSDKNLRASLENYSVFYCSNSPKVSMLECRVGKNEVAFIGEWKPKLIDDIRLLPFINYDTELGSNFPNFYSSINEELDKLINKCGVDVKPQMIALFEFVASAFVEDTKNYSISSWVAGWAYTTQQCDAVAYPSFMADKKALNFAFLPQVANDFLLETVYEVTTTSQHEINFVDVELLRVGESRIDSIRWRSKTSDDELRLKMILDI